MCIRGIFLVLILLMSNLVFAQRIPLQDTQEVDSAQIYYDLIADENYQAYYKPNVTGTIVGGD